MLASLPGSVRWERKGLLSHSAFSTSMVAFVDGFVPGIMLQSSAEQPVLCRGTNEGIAAAAELRLNDGSPQACFADTIGLSRSCKACEGASWQ